MTTAKPEAGIKPVWDAIDGPQRRAYESAADVTGYGGAAGGGKTDLACGLALTRHRVSAIFRREGTQLSAIVDRLGVLLGGRKGYNGVERIWRLGDGRQIEFGSTPHPGDERRYQGRPKDLLVLDEAANFLESQARFLMGWVRTTDPQQRCRVLMTFNPPATAEGRWIISFFAPWLDDKHPNPAKPCELRWFASAEGREWEVADGRAFVLQDGEPVYDFDASAVRAEAIITPTSRTFIASRVADNPYLAGTGYMATLQALPEPLRSQMLQGDFTAGLEDDRWQVIPTAWVDAAMARWAERRVRGPMDSMGVDVARGGRDQTIIARRHGEWFDALVSLAGPETPDGPSVAGQVIQHRRDRAVVHIDVVGWGASPYDFLAGNGVQTVAVNGAAKASARTREGQLSFVNLRAQLWWRLREALDPHAEPQICLPADTVLRADLCAPRWRQTVTGILVEPKEDIIARIGRSPDRGDAVVMALMATPKAGVRREAGVAAREGSWMG